MPGEDFKSFQIKKMISDLKEDTNKWKNSIKAWRGNSEMWGRGQQMASETMGYLDNSKSETWNKYSARKLRF